jgi:dienelactone hydrolase
MVPVRLGMPRPALKFVAIHTAGNFLLWALRREDFMLRGIIGFLACLLSGSAIAQPAKVPDDPWSLTRDIEIVSRWPIGERLEEDLVTAELYRPVGDRRVPAAVIINSSGGITAQTELTYARVLARHGMAALVIDSFRPRNVRRTGDDQSRVPQTRSNADAIAGLRWLLSQSWVDPTRIVVLGMSRGGEAAIAAAIEPLRERMRASDVRFAAHVAIAPGGCNFQQRDVRTTGAPIFFMLAELDDGTPAMPCVEYIQRIRAAGNQMTRWAVYPGVFHTFESTGGIGFARMDWTGRACAGRYFRGDRYALYDRSSGNRVTAGNLAEYLRRTCLEFGYTVGGDGRVKAQATADLLQFLRDAEILRDDEVRAVVPDCAGFPEGIHRRNCIRARNGWTGDLVALARGLRDGPVKTQDSALIVRLFELAAARGHAQAQWELALIFRQGKGAAKDYQRALGLARLAAEAGDAAGLNIYAVMIRDGIGRSRDDAEAAIWFQRAADLRNSYGMTNLARFMWEGRGGLPVDRAAAVALWRRAIYQDNNPWAQLFVAQALDKGEGADVDKVEARRLFRSAAEQDREPDAKRRAVEALSRL